MKTRWKEIAGMLEPKPTKKSTLKKPVPDEKDITIEYDYKQKMISWWYWAESSSSTTNQVNWNVLLSKFCVLVWRLRNFGARLKGLKAGIVFVLGVSGVCVCVGVWVWMGLGVGVGV